MRLPYFPLHGVVFPHLPLPLQIFEERYRSMVRDILADGSPYAGRFVTSVIVEGAEVGGDPAVTRSTGTICEVRQAERHADGRWSLLAVGVTRAALGEVDRSPPYALAEAHPLEDAVGDMTGDLLRSVQSALDEYLVTVKRFVASAASIGSASQEITDVTASLDEVLRPIRLPADPSAASYAVGGVLQIELLRKQQLLELPDAASRLRAELDLLRRESHLLAEGSLPPVSTGDLGYHPN